MKTALTVVAGILTGSALVWALNPQTWIRRRQLREVRKFRRWWE